MRMRFARLVVVLLLVLAACGGAGSPGELELAFQDASRDFDVPRDLLVSMAFGVSRFDDRGGRANTERGYGVMNLVDDEGGPSLGLAADLIDADPGTVRADPAANIRAAAALLRYYADIHEAASGRRMERIGDWFAVVAEYSGAQDLQVRGSYARQVYRFIEGGLDFVAPDGERITIEPREVVIDDYDAMLMASATDYGGAAQFVPADPSNYSDYGRGYGDIDTIVIHTTQGSYAGAISWFQNPASNVSAHYVVRSSDGEVTQVVREEDVAWHAGNWDVNLHSVGIEHEGYVESPELWYTEAMYYGSAMLVRDIADRNGIPLDRSHIIGHSEVPGATHTDPGPGWDWSYFMDLVVNGSSSGSPSGGASSGTASGSGSVSTGELVGFVRHDDIYDENAGIAGASVTLSDGRSVTADGRGYYSFGDLAPGQWQVTASASGYDTASATKEVQAGMTNWKSLALVASSSSGSSSGSGTASAPGQPVYVDPVNYAVDRGPTTTMSWTPQGEPADYFEVVVYWWTGRDWAWYYTYDPTGNYKTFWPQVGYTFYAFAVRGVNSRGAGPWSDWGSFYFQP